VPSGRSRDGVEMIDTLWHGLKYLMRKKSRLVSFKDRPTCELDMTKMFNELCERLFRTYPDGWDYEQFRGRMATKLYQLYGEETEK